MVLADNSMDPWLTGTGESRVSVVEAELQLEVEDLARTKWMTGTGLPSCNPQSWIEWLADDVVLSLRLGAVDTSQISERLTSFCLVSFRCESRKVAPCQS